MQRAGLAAAVSLVMGLTAACGDVARQGDASSVGRPAPPTPSGVLVAAATPTPRRYLERPSCDTMPPPLPDVVPLIAGTHFFAYCAEANGGTWEYWIPEGQADALAWYTTELAARGFKAVRSAPPTPISLLIESDVYRGAISYVAEESPREAAQFRFVELLGIQLIRKSDASSDARP